MKNFLLMINPFKSDAVDFAEKLIDFLIEEDCKVCTLFEYKIYIKNEKIKFVYYDNLSDIDVVIILGGDGTAIRGMRKLKRYELPVFGINFGHLGYLTQCEQTEAFVQLKKVINNDYSIEERMLLKGEIETDGVKNSFTVINEAVLFRSNMLHAINVVLKINESYIDTFSGDGILVSTPTGSTAYNLSAGGPVIIPTASNMVITPICSQSFFSRSIVTSGDDVITLTFDPSREETVSPKLTADGAESFECNESTKITLKKSAYKIKIIKTNNDSFYRSLQKKLYKNSGV